MFNMLRKSLSGESSKLAEVTTDEQLVTSEDTKNAKRHRSGDIASTSDESLSNRQKKK